MRLRTRAHGVKSLILLDMEWGGKEVLSDAAHRSTLLEGALNDQAGL